MKLQAGALLKSTEALNDTEFSHAKIFLTEYNANGAVGYVLNKPFGRSLNELEEFKHGLDFPLYDGGPVDKEHLFFLHRRPDVIDGGVAVANGIYNGGNFKKAVHEINDQRLTAYDIKIFVGYCGWDAGELETEIAEGSWVVTEEAKERLFA
jgi:putative transcriptional regulator